MACAARRWFLCVSFFLFAAGVSAAEDLDCIIEPKEEAKISSQVPGIIEEVLVERGDMVEKGQVLATLKSGVEAASANLARARLDFGKRKLARNEELFLKEHVSAHEKDEMETEIQIAELQLHEATERLEMRTIRSPIEGVVKERFLSPGEYVGENPILTVSLINPLNVEVVVPVRLYGSIKKGMNAQIRPESPVGGVHTGKVVIVDRVMDAASGTFGVRVELPNPTHRLPAGLKCKARFTRN